MAQRREVLARNLLVAATAVALVWANSPWDDAYRRVWSGTTRHVVNDGLMVAFFAVIGLELKRELVLGELRDRRHATLPVVAAAGGMVVPAALYLAINGGGSGARGWGIPMATDVPFALGVAVLLGPRLPPALRLFILALAIVDDVGAIAIIAVFYAGRLGWAWLPLAGVAMALAVPARSCRRLERALLPWTSLVVVPLFALANAGVSLSGSALGDAARSPVTWGVVLGLVVGKPVGISLFAWVACRLRIAAFPAGMTWRQFVGAAALCGVGFTVSLFITGLAFDSAVLIEHAKAGIVGASLLAPLVAALVLHSAVRQR